MTADNLHHLEGVLSTGGIFRLYLYDAFTRPLGPAEVKLAVGTVHKGEYADPPGMPLVLGKDGQALEAAIGSVKFPVTLTLLLRFPGSNPERGEPDLFNFTFEDFSKDPHGNAP